MKYTHASLCQTDSFSCMGCCARFGKGKEEIARHIEVQTKEAELLTDVVAFRDRRGPCNVDTGVCCNVVFDKHKVATPLQAAEGKDHRRVVCAIHPKRHSGKDARVGFCDVLHMCKTAYLFDLWPVEEQRRFLRFLRSKDLDWFSYSQGMDEGGLLVEFEGLF